MSSAIVVCPTCSSHAHFILPHGQGSSREFLTTRMAAAAEIDRLERHGILNHDEAIDFRLEAMTNPRLFENHDQMCQALGTKNPEEIIKISHSPNKPPSIEGTSLWRPERTPPRTYH